MKAKLLGQIALAAVLAASAAFASSSSGQRNAATDDEIARQVRHEVLTYSHYTLWDDINFTVNQGAVELNGAVTQPYKKADLGKIVQRVPGVASVTNRLEVLPLSPMDDSLRLQVARAIYRDPSLARYGFGAVPPIHVIVDNGHVKLTGVVASSFDKQVAGTRASSVLSFGEIDNELRVENLGKRG